MSDLFGKEIVRSLGLYQPYATLMLHGKIESRWVKIGRKAPFPLGKYLIYSTQKAYTNEMFTGIAGQYAESARPHLIADKTVQLQGFAIAVGELASVGLLLESDKPRAFVDLPLDAHSGEFTLWGLHFIDVKRIEPFPFRGKQGVGILKPEEIAKIKLSPSKEPWPSPF